MKHLKKRFSLPDNIFKIHWDMIKTAAAAAFYSFEPFLTHIRVQISFHFRFLCSGWPGSNPMVPNTCPNSGLRPTAKKKISKIECCFRPDKMSGDPSLKQKTPNPWGLYATYASDATQSVGLALMTSTNHQQMLRLIQFSPIISFYDTNAAKSLIALWQTEHQY